MQVVADLQQLKLDLQELASILVDDVSDLAAQTRERLTQAADRIDATYEAVKAEGLASAHAAGEQIDTHVRVHPYRSLGLAFGVGVLVGALVRK